MVTARNSPQVNGLAPDEQQVASAAAGEESPHEAEGAVQLRGAQHGEHPHIDDEHAEADDPGADGGEERVRRRPPDGASEKQIHPPPRGRRRA